MTTIKDQLLAGFAEYREELVVLTHPARPTFKIVCATVVDGERVRRLSQQAEKGKKPAWWINAVLIGEQNREIRVVGDEPMLDDDGEVATFRTPAVLDYFGAETVAEAVRKAYGSDVYLAKVAESLLAQSGFDDEVEVEPLDPTHTV